MQSMKFVSERHLSLCLRSLYAPLRKQYSVHESTVSLICINESMEIVCECRARVPLYPKRHVYITRWLGIYSELAKRNTRVPSREISKNTDRERQKRETCTCIRGRITTNVNISNIFWRITPRETFSFVDCMVLNSSRDGRQALFCLFARLFVFFFFLHRCSFCRGFQESLQFFFFLFLVVSSCCTFH